MCEPLEIARALADRLTADGVGLQAIDGKLIVTPGSAGLTDEDREQIRANKPVLLTLLASSPVGPPPATAPQEPPEPARPFYRIRSRLLAGEVIVCAEDDYTGQLPAGVVYRRSEIERMRGLTPDQVRAVHAAKVFGDGGTYLGPTPKREAVPVAVSAVTVEMFAERGGAR